MKNLVKRLGVLALLSGPWMGCSSDFDPASQISTLRVLAVRAERPFAAPGTQATLTMLLHDGSPRALRSDGSRRTVQVVWLGGCVDPRGDLYYQCYPALHASAGRLSDSQLATGTLPSDLEPGVAGYGTTFGAQVPSNILTERPQPAGTSYPYGLQFVFFIACGGEVRRDLSANPSTEFPLACFQPGTQARLGDADVVVGYYPLYSYDSLENHNPEVQGGQFAAAGPASPCTLPSECPAASTCGSAGLCIPSVPVCPDNRPDDCPGFAFQPTVDRTSVEPAISAQTPASRAQSETLWVTYYSSGGRLESDALIIHDPTAGWIEAHGTTWRAWNVKGEVRLWAVVRDSRNGVSWWFQDVAVE
jgi:hypothetical protein